ncbi:uncharacterized protein LOC128834283 [Malaclemys terrapin pileata]|uniref:uncharacterized protein LOC128834283 n=1 Tax=Malaclemys terrapin pileata TaxID=2991368 RepID=UPI0023A85BF6|nr:uncharacterized protein LOC128834283 [Malaclemys terrapin pileata]
MLADGEDEEGEEVDEAVDSTHNADFPDSQDLFITLTEIPYQPSPAVTPDTESGEGSATPSATVSQPSLASHSQRLARIRHRKKRTREDMFSELMACSRAQAAQQTQWRENLSQMQQANMDREERWRQEDQQATQTLLGLLREQTDTLRRLVDVLQERRVRGIETISKKMSSNDKTTKLELARLEAAEKEKDRQYQTWQAEMGLKETAAALEAEKQNEKKRISRPQKSQGG